MNFKYINKTKILSIILSGFLIISITGCDKNYTKENNETEVLHYFQEQEAQINSLEENALIEKGREIFITSVDFLFYEEEINGYTFSELTDKTKQEIISIINNIDSKIEEKYPSYKETISSESNQLISKIDEQIENGAENIEKFSKEKLGEETYQEIITSVKDIWEADKEKIKDVKEDIMSSQTTKDAIESGKNLIDDSKNILSESKTKIKNWYENFKK